MDALLTWQTMLFSLGVFAFSHSIRRALEKLFPTLSPKTPLTKAQIAWEEVFLPAVPVLVGVTMALVITSYPYPSLLHSAGSRVVYGTVMGFFCSWTFRLVKAILVKKFNINLPDPTAPSDRPPSV